MSNYAQLTNFTAKDALTTGDPAKIVKGADIDAELSAISTAISTKYDSSNYPFASGTKLPFYQASAPTGWTDSALSDVALVAVTQASTNGGSTTGSWTITGLSGTQPAHTHGPGTFGAGGYQITTISAGTISGPAGTSFAAVGAIGVVGTSSSSGGDAVTVSSDGTWRPARAYVIICSKN